MKWKPIETAPRDEDVIVVNRSDPGRVRIAWRGSITGEWWISGAGMIQAVNPTHWMPIPLVNMVEVHE